MAAGTTHPPICSSPLVYFQASAAAPTNFAQANPQIQQLTRLRSRASPSLKRKLHDSSNDPLSLDSTCTIPKYTSVDDDISETETEDQQDADVFGIEKGFWKIHKSARELLHFVTTYQEHRAATAAAAGLGPTLSSYSAPSAPTSGSGGPIGGAVVPGRFAASTRTTLSLPREIDMLSMTQLAWGILHAVNDININNQRLVAKDACAAPSWLPSGGIGIRREEEKRQRQGEGEGEMESAYAAGRKRPIKRARVRRNVEDRDKEMANINSTNNYNMTVTRARARELAGARARAGANTGTRPTFNGCVQCAVSDSPQWRSGPAGPLTLCNVCGLLFAKRESQSQSQIIKTAVAAAAVTVVPLSLPLLSLDESSPISSASSIYS